MPTGGAHGHAVRPPGWEWSLVPDRRAGAPARCFEHPTGPVSRARPEAPAGA
ncbi:hypothetical protein FM117_01200 [Micrococcus luteus Mu201]|nr:hypothetical protein FM117_01200 [Micrococcus luteus Mu201]